MRRDARILKRKAVASLRRAAAAFNGLDDEGRHTTVLIHLQHAFEMLLKAALYEKRATIVDAATGQSVGFKKCLNLATAQIPLRAEDAGTLRAIDQLRDDEYHYLGLVSEGILYLHLRAAISIFDRILQEVFGETLADQLPARVLPISTQPPEDLQVLIDREYTQVRALLSPGHREGPEARARIRTLLALEGHVAEDAEVRNSDVTRVERAVRGGSERAAVFPRLENLTSQTLGLEVSIKVHTTRREGAPVRFVADGEAGEAGAVRDVDLQARYPFSKTELAQHVKLTAPKTAALRAHLQIDGNAEYHHQFTFGHMTHDGYSHAALRAMREALEGGVDMDAVWAAHRTRRRPLGGDGRIQAALASSLDDPSGRATGAGDVPADPRAVGQQDQVDLPVVTLGNLDPIPHQSGAVGSGGDAGSDRGVEVVQGRGQPRRNLLP